MFRKSLAVAVILLFIGMGIVPSTAVQELKEKPFPINFDGNTLYVGGSGPNNYTRIQDAIDNASDGDAVFVYSYSSPYYENVVVNKSINLIGENKDTTVIDGGCVSGHGSDVVTISADMVTLTGFTVKNLGWLNGQSGGDGIRLEGNHCTINNNIVKDNYWGIATVDGYGNLEFVVFNNHINNNVVSGNKFGISISGSNNTISGNSLVDNLQGISVSGWSDNDPVNFHFGVNNVISQNIIIMNESKITHPDNRCIGIWMLLVDSTNISWNTIFATTSPAHTGIFLQDSFNNTIYMNNISNCENGIGFGYVYHDPPTLKKNCFWSPITEDLKPNFVKHNNFRKNRFHASFRYKHYFVGSHWEGNYWGRPRLLPKVIFVLKMITANFGIPTRVQFDWHPASEPYDIGV